MLTDHGDISDIWLKNILIKLVHEYGDMPEFRALDERIGKGSGPPLISICTQFTF